jgi:hypothetical protein
MGSNRKKTTKRRKAKSTKMGKSRKTLIRREGTTPAFPIHPETETK